MITLTEEQFKEMIEAAHRAGQHNQGHCDPSAYEAMVYYEREVKKLIIPDVMRSANCYNELKAFLQDKKKSPKLCAWDSVHHQEIWDKMLELEQKYSEHYA